MSSFNPSLNTELSIHIERKEREIERERGESRSFSLYTFFSGSPSLRRGAQLWFFNGGGEYKHITNNNFNIFNHFLFLVEDYISTPPQILVFVIVNNLFLSNFKSKKRKYIYLFISPIRGN